MGGDIEFGNEEGMSDESTESTTNVGEAGSTSTSRRDAILMQNREQYHSSRMSIKQGQNLDSDFDSVPLVTGGSTQLSNGHANSTIITTNVYSPFRQTNTVFTPDNDSKWFPITSTLNDTSDELVFSVKASNDAHIALGSAKDEPDGRNLPNHVEIFIGEGDNSSSGILRSVTNDVTNQVEVREPILVAVNSRLFALAGQKISSS